MLPLSPQPPPARCHAVVTPFLGPSLILKVSPSPLPPPQPVCRRWCVLSSSTRPTAPGGGGQLDRLPLAPPGSPWKHGDARSPSPAPAHGAISASQKALVGESDWSTRTLPGVNRRCCPARGVPARWSAAGCTCSRATCRSFGCARFAPRLLAHACCTAGKAKAPKHPFRQRRPCSTTQRKARWRTA